MSNQNINISPKNIKGKCDLKCSYMFKYPESNSVATNNGVMISLTYDESKPSVIYNNQKYTVNNIYIVTPSIHNFNDTQAAGEIVIEHAPVSGGLNLSVAIPFKSSSESSNASNLITEIIQSVANNAPTEGETTNLNITNFTLQEIVPKKPFYSYTDDQNNTDWIVYGILEAIPLSSSIITTLGQIIKPYALSTTGSSLFINSRGPKGISLDDGIYISCQPTGSSTDETSVTYSTNPTSYNLSSLLDNPNALLIFQIIIGFIIFIAVFLLLNYGYSFLTSDAPKLPKFSIPKI
jgi:carbonic anhydrase